MRSSGQVYKHYAFIVVGWRKHLGIFNRNFHNFKIEWCIINNPVYYEDNFLIQYKARPIPTITTPTHSKIWIIGAVCGVSALFIIMLATGILIYYKMKKKQNRYEQMFDLLREMQITPEEIMDFKEKSDKMFIKKENLFIRYDEILGRGACSTVYKGHLTGPSPLHLTTRMIETQKYGDCDVAVKVARNLGPGEVEQLYKEIQAMKTLGYHENLMAMFGWAMPDDTPALVFDIAKFNLLDFVRKFQDLEKNEIPFKSFSSILWQIARGKILRAQIL